MYVVTVIPLKKGTFKEELTYFSSQNIPLFSIVTVTLRGKEMLGLAIDIESASDLKSEIKEARFNLKKIVAVKEQHLFKPELLMSALETSAYFVSNKSYTITTLIPNIFREEYDKIVKFENRNLPAEDNINNPKNIRSEKLLLQTNLEDRLSFYKSLIRGHFANKKSVFVVLPTQGDIEFFEESLSKGIEQFTFSFSSELPAKKTLAKVKEVLALDHSVLVLGTAPYLSLPRNDFATIILEHENSNAYKTIAGPNIDMRIFTEIFASKINAKLVIGDTLLRFETIARKEIENLGEARTMSFRANFNGDLKILGREPNEDKKQKFAVLADESIAEISSRLDKKQSVFIFTLRKGLGTTTVCRDCGDTLFCDKCSAPFILYLSKNRINRMYVCNRCGNEENTKILCKNCHSWNLESLGIGTDTVYEDVKKNFPNTMVFVLDKESAKDSKGAEKIAKEFEENHGSILIGTEMALFYLGSKVPLSIIASFDSLWSIPNFKMSEKIVGLVLSIISRTENTFIIQTKNDKDDALLAIRNDNLVAFVRNELEDRKNLGYPPYKRFIKISYAGGKDDTEKAKEFLAEFFKEYKPTIFDAFISKVKGQYVTNALIKVDRETWSLPSLLLGSKIESTLSKKLTSLNDVFNISIDPEDLL